MIKSIESLLIQLKGTVNDSDIKILKEWGESIIDECAGNFECTMESNDDDPNIIDIEDYNGTHPVLVRQSIFDVEKQLI